MKKKIICFFLLPTLFFGFILFLLLFAIIVAGEDDTKPEKIRVVTGLNLSEEVLAYSATVESYANQYEIGDYVGYLLAIMMVESGGVGNDVMQASESLGLPPNTLTPTESIEQGVKYFAGLLATATEKGCDISTVVQAYNYGGGFIDYVAQNGNEYTFELAQEFAKEKSDGKQVDYGNELACQINGGWRYDYGNMFYVLLVNQYLYVREFDDFTVQTIMDEALLYEGISYVWGGSTPETGFDCSGLTQWCFSMAGIELPRTAQEQYDATQHIPLSEAKPGDLVFFQGTYDTANYITHVGIYVGDNYMYHAGSCVGYADISTEYWQSHLVSAGRIKK